MTAREHRLLEAAKVAYGWGWGGKPCRLCPSKLTHRTSRGDYLCWWHWREPIQMGFAA